MSIRKILALLIVLLMAASVGAQSRALKLKVTTKKGKTIDLYSGSYALVIGNSRYTNGWPSLPGVKEDVTAVKEALENKGFEVTVVQDLDRQEMLTAFDNFINKHGHNVNNRLIFYFAGHGHTLKLLYGDEMGYIVPVNSPNPNVDQNGFISTALDMQMVEVYAKRIQSKHAMFLFDSCFSGSIFALSRAVPDNISYKTAKPVRQFITSGSANEEVPDESVFRRQFVDGINGEADSNGDGYITGVELGEYLQNSVVNYTKGAQHPQYGKIRNPHLDKGDFVFFGQIPDNDEQMDNKVASVAPPPPPVAVAGHLQVNVNVPSADVYIDGRKAGTASFGKPFNKSNLPTGIYNIKVISSGGKSKFKDANIKLNQWSQLVFDFPKSSAPAKPEVKNVYSPNKVGGNGRLVFSENFTNNSRKWVEKNNSTVSYSVYGGEYHINRKATNSRSNCTWVTESYSDDKDYVIEAELRKVSGVDNYGYGIFFGADGTNNAYRFEVSGTGKYVFGAFKDGKWNALVPWGANSAVNKDNSRNVLRVEQKGKDLMLYINNNKVKTLAAQPFFGSQIGFCVNSNIHMAANKVTIHTGGGLSNVAQGGFDVMNETFNSNDRNWSEKNNSEISYDVRNGRYYIHKKIDNKKGNCTWVTKNFKEHNGFKIETLIKKYSGKDNWGYGLFFGGENYNNSYHFEISSNGKYHLGKFDGGKWQSILAWSSHPSIIKNESTNKLAVEHRNGEYILYINDTEVSRTPFQSFFGHKVGYCVNNEIEMSADYLRLTQY